MSDKKFDIFLREIRVTRPDGSLLFSVPRFELPFGSHLLIQGASGKGKTTFLHMLAGLFRPQRGSIQLGSFDYSKMNDQEICDLRRKEVGVIFQKLNLIDHMTVAENVSLSASGEVDFQKRETILKSLQMSGFENARCSRLSLGEQQRVAVARVLIQEPSLLLADEPTSSLDHQNGEFVMKALKQASKGKTLVVVSHDLRISDQFDQVIQFEEFCR